VKGVDPGREKAVTRLHERLFDGSWESLSEKGEDVPVLLGKELAKTLNVTVGDEVLLLAPSEGGAVMASLPRFYPFRVAGVLETGLYDYDASLALTTMDAAQAVFQMQGSWTGLGLRVADPEDTGGVAMRLQKTLGSGAWVRSWLGMNRNLFAALKLEKVVMFIVLALITLVAAFMIVSNLLLVTAQRVHEIGILRAMGATRASIGKIFLVKGFLMGSFGTGAGLALGSAIAWLLKRYQFIQLPADVYYVETLPVKVLASDVGLVAGAALGIVLLATVYPARLAAKLDSLDAIRQI
jgi:lipoprotein-releasing system permease protein